MPVGRVLAAGRADYRSWCGPGYHSLLPAMRTTPRIPPDIEDYRDGDWRREGTRPVETALKPNASSNKADSPPGSPNSVVRNPCFKWRVWGPPQWVIPPKRQKDPEGSP